MLCPTSLPSAPMCCHPGRIRNLADLAQDWRRLDERIEAVTDEIEALSKNRIRDLVALRAFKGLAENEMGCVRISMMARSKHALPRAKYRRARPVATGSPIPLATHGRSIQKCQYRSRRRAAAGPCRHRDSDEDIVWAAKADAPRLRPDEPMHANPML